MVSAAPGHSQLPHPESTGQARSSSGKPSPPLRPEGSVQVWTVAVNLTGARTWWTAAQLLTGCRTEPLDSESRPVHW